MNKTLYAPSTTIQLSDMEITNITNFLVKESIEIIQEELDYFFLNKDGMVKPIVQEILSNRNLDLKNLRCKLNRFLFTIDDINLLVQKIEYRINKEIRMAKWHCTFAFDHGAISWLEPGCIVSMLHEEGKTLSYSNSMAKIIDTAWGKVSGQVIPGGIKHLSRRVNMGEMFLAAVKVDAKSLKNGIECKIYKLIEGYIKQYKTQLCHDLNQQVCAQLFPAEMCELEREALVKIQSA